MYDRPRRLDFPIPRKEVITKAGTHRAVIYVPSTTDQSRKIPDKQFQKRIDSVSKAIADTFGGNTVQRMSFGSEIRNNRLISEKIARIEFFTTPSGYKENDAEVGRMVHTLAEKWGQWGISYEYQSPKQARALYFVHPLKREKLKEMM